MRERQKVISWVSWEWKRQDGISSATSWEKNARSIFSQSKRKSKRIKTDVSKEIIIYHQICSWWLKNMQKNTKCICDVAWRTGIEIRSKIDKKYSNDIYWDQSESWEVYTENDTKPAVIIDFNFSKLNTRGWRCHRLVSTFGTTFASKQILP